MPCLISKFEALSTHSICQANFVSPVQIRKLWILGGGDEDKEQHPSELKVYVNKEGLDFTGIHDHTPTQVFQIPVDSDGMELHTLVHAFNNVNSIHFFFSQNHGADSTAIQYIGMQGMVFSLLLVVTSCKV